MLFRSLAALALALTATLLARPAQAAMFPPDTKWVLTCQQHGLGGGPYYRSRSFVTTTDEPSAVERAAKESWTAFLRSKYGVTDGYGVFCAVEPLRDFFAVAQRMLPQHVTMTDVDDWAPGFGAPFQLPRSLYYYCTSTQYRQTPRPRIAVTDLFKMPTPTTYSPTLAELMGDPRTRKQGIHAFTESNNEFGDDKRCMIVEPEAYKAYVRDLNEMSKSYDLVRNSWPSPDPAAAPNLIDDLAARAKYATLSIGPKLQAEKGPAPKPAPAKGGAAPIKQTALTVKADPSIEESSKRLAENIQKGLQKEAEQKAKIAALKAKDDAEFQAKVKAFWAERRRQGNAQ